MNSLFILKVKENLHKPQENFITNQIDIFMKTFINMLVSLLHADKADHGERLEEDEYKLQH